jgi:transcriptional regulator with XRE-family HTH domain
MSSDYVAGQLIAQMRSRARLSQAELARAAGMTRSVVNAYERGRRQPSVEALARLAGAAGLRLRLDGAQALRLDPERAARILEQVLDLAERLPYRRPGRLTYPTVLAAQT